ncbi:MAG: PAS domain S-box protein [Thermodesulfobacteriota bacterium]
MAGKTGQEQVDDSLEEKLTQAIARRQELENELDHYKLMVDQASDLMHSVTPEGRFLYVNETWKEVLGYSDEEISNLQMMDIVAPDCRGTCNEIFQCLINGDQIDRNQTTFIARNGSRIKVEGRCRTHFQDGKPLMMTGVFRNTTDKNLHTEALQDSEMRYQDLFENAHDLIQIVQPDGKLLYVNHSWRQTFGYSEEEVKSLTIFKLIARDCHDHCQNVFQQVISKAGVHVIRSTFQAKNGRRVFVEGNAKCKFDDEGQPLYTQCIFNDVTDKRRMEEELFKAQKLESVGVFAGGIAHDFNNLLTAILGNISMARFHLDEQHPAWQRLARTEKASMQAKNLTQQLLTFSKGGAPILRTTSINDLLEDSIGFTLRGSSIKPIYELAPELWPTKVDSGQLSQVTQNLALNASQAMTGSGGKFTVTSANVNLAKDELPPLPAGDYIHLSFKDQGHGISEKDITRIFDPYYSNKATGSGLGLAISYSIIKQHDGHISVESSLEEGATFHIYLPASPNEKLPAFQPPRKTASLNGKILFMDDDDIVLDATVDMLSALGCEVEVARDGEEAIEIYRKALQDKQPFSGVIMDLTIPGGMGGKETIDHLRRIDPEVKAIVSSGYANDPIMANHEQYGFSGVVPKPYTMEDLSRAVRELL